MPFLPPNQQRQSTEGQTVHNINITGQLMTPIQMHNIPRNANKVQNFTKEKHQLDSQRKKTAIN